MNKKTVSKMLIALTLVLGVASFLTFFIYLYSANHAPYKYTGVISAGPVFSFIGIIILIITRKSRKMYPILWTSGLIICLSAFMLCFLIILLLSYIVASMFNGTYL